MQNRLFLVLFDDLIPVVIYGVFDFTNVWSRFWLDSYRIFSYNDEMTGRLTLTTHPTLGPPSPIKVR